MPNLFVIIALGFVVLFLAGCVKVEVPDGATADPNAGQAPTGYVDPTTAMTGDSHPDVAQGSATIVDDTGSNAAVPMKGTTTVDAWPADKPYPYEFNGISHWLNLENDRQTLTRKELRGRVVLVDFWTYSCINCIRTLPYTTGWDAKYRDEGLTVVGIHTPEFAFEKQTDNVADAIKRYNISYPVGQDNNYVTWQTYDNSYWPHVYLFDREGKLVYDHIGEGGDDEIDRQIRKALGESVTADDTLIITTPERSGRVSTPEIYLGGDSTRGNTGYSSEKTEKVYTFPAMEKAETNTAYIDGPWAVKTETIAAAGTTEEPSKLLLKYGSRDLHIVAGGKGTVTPVVDGVALPAVAIDGQRLYTLASTAYGDHTAILTVSSGVELYTFTFG